MTTIRFTITFSSEVDQAYDHTDIIEVLKEALEDRFQIKSDDGTAGITVNVETFHTTRAIDTTGATLIVDNREVKKL